MAVPEEMEAAYDEKVRLICQEATEDDYLALEQKDTHEILIRTPMQVIFYCLTDYSSYCKRIFEVEEVA